MTKYWLAGATALTLLSGAALAQNAAPAVEPATSASAAAVGPHKGKSHAEMSAETVEQRIASLHGALKITPDEEANWTPVAKAMRDNNAAMEKLVAAKRTERQQSVTAIDDLTDYQEFAQAHVDGLKNLTSAFQALYSSMPDGQKKEADAVFQNFGRKAHRAHV